MFKKDFNLSKQIFISLSVSLVLFIAGLAWALPTLWRANAWVAAEFNMISDRYIPGQGFTSPGNLFVKSSHWGNIVNRVEADPGKPDDITGIFPHGVAWYNKNSWPFPPATDIDWATVDAAGGSNNSVHYYLPDPWNQHLFFAQRQHGKQNVNPADYWAGAYSTLGFNKGNVNPGIPPGIESGQLKVPIQRWAPTGTLYNVNYDTRGWTFIYIGQ